MMMRRVGRAMLVEVNDAVRRSGLRPLGRNGHGRLAMSVCQTQTRKAVGEAEIHELASRMRTSVGVAFVGAAAALSFGLSPELDSVAYSRAANALPLPSTSSSDRRQRWHLFDKIGSGSFGTVRLGMCEDSGEVAAIKIVEPDQRNYATLEREIAALKLIKAFGGHRNIIDLRDVYVEARKVFLVTELVRGGELYDHIVAFGAFDEAQASALTKDVSEALSFLHRHGLVHKDVKPENILLTSKTSQKESAVTSDGARPPIVKLADFGSAGPASSSGTLDDIGTSAYLPPELLQSGICTPACDMWALGCVLYISLCGAHPFDLEGTASDEEVEFRVKHMPITFEFAAWQNVSADAKDLILHLLHKDPTKRLTADQLLTHPWIVMHNSAASSINAYAPAVPTVVTAAHV